MKWKAVLPDGSVLDVTGSDAREAGMAAARRTAPPKTALDPAFIVEVSRSAKTAKRMPGEKETTKVVIVPQFYWYADYGLTEAANR